MTNRELVTELSQVSPTRPERAEAPSPGQRPGLLRTQTCRPVRAKALKLQANHKAFALTIIFAFAKKKGKISFNS